ncbi:DnaB-like helicase N-terminal domain-containing protein [Streptomyces decoyicus]|uniref:DnaB-like helicase N-terminal domain-containing protein n=1 Tax=Streptomyces decoyicus TaxID=249567 RepID=UPI0036337A73
MADRPWPRLAALFELALYLAVGEVVVWDEAHASVPSPPGAGDSERSTPSQQGAESEKVRSTSLPGALLNPNRLIYEAIIDLHNAGRAVGVPQVAAELERRGQLEFCGGEDYLFECVKVSIKGAYEVGMSIPEFTVMNAHQMCTAVKAREELLISVFPHGSDSERVRRACDRVAELHPHWVRQQGEREASK